MKEMVAPGLMAIVVPVIAGFIDPLILGGLLAGVTTSGVAMAIFMSNAGGAWDNAKKHIEAGNFGGKGSEAHKAAVNGDTVGDPFKDTAGPALNILLKLMSVVALVLAPVIALDSVEQAVATSAPVVEVVEVQAAAAAVAAPAAEAVDAPVVVAAQEVAVALDKAPQVEAEPAAPAVAEEKIEKIQ
jgi:K(+)-stimulated pyrophosphate-energized sodium pump